jgi:hypothetical protein
LKDPYTKNYDYWSDSDLEDDNSESDVIDEAQVSLSDEDLSEESLPVLPVNESSDLRRDPFYMDAYHGHDELQMADLFFYSAHANDEWVIICQQMLKINLQ